MATGRYEAGGHLTVTQCLKLCNQMRWGLHDPKAASS